MSIILLLDLVLYATFVVNATHLVPIDLYLIWDLIASLQFRFCSGIPDPMQVGSLMMLIASFPLLGLFDFSRSFRFGGFS